jgi:hypothetical protein
VGASSAVGVQKLTKRVEADQLTTLMMLRQVFVGSCILLAIISVGLVAVVLSATESQPIGPVWIAFMLGAVLTPIGFRFCERPLDCTTDAALAAGSSGGNVPPP